LALRERWRGRIVLQGVALVVLSYFRCALSMLVLSEVAISPLSIRDEAAGAALADAVAAAGGVLGAAVSCSDRGGLADDDATTCSFDQPLLLDRLFALASARGLDVDVHVDENGNAESRGLQAVAMAALRCSAFRGRLTCGHCCALAAQPPEALAATLDVARKAGLTVVSLPAVNLWLQDRDAASKRTPQRRGVTLLKELADAGVPVALASDNTRDQFYAYGDLDMLDVFRDAVRIGHLDRPFGEWPAAITTTPARAMGLPADFATFCPGASAVRVSNLLLTQHRG
jgi:cytosine/adenosine deaminase-related metal-dependent hydrolase